MGAEAQHMAGNFHGRRDTRHRIEAGIGLNPMA